MNKTISFTLKNKLRCIKKLSGKHLKDSLEEKETKIVSYPIHDMQSIPFRIDIFTCIRTFVSHIIIHI